MARSDKGVLIHLTQLHWDEVIVVTGGGGFGDDVPTENPYMWTVFFKADGSTLQVTDALQVVGSSVTESSPGSHGNLGASNVTVGAPVDIPSSVGFWTSQVLPIPVATSVQSLVGPDLPGFFGAVAVLMLEGGHIPEHAAEAGRLAVQSAVQSALDTLIGELGPSHSMITQQDVDAVTAGLDQRVSDAITNSMDFWEQLWAITGPDQNVGYKLWYWNTDAFPDTTDTESMNTELSTTDFGDWGIDGTVVVNDTCPANTSLFIIHRHDPSSSAASAGAEAMRRFRDRGGLRDAPALSAWWQIASRHSSELATLLEAHPPLRHDVAALLGAMAPILADAPLPEGFVATLHRSLGLLMKHGSHRLAVDALRARDLLASVPLRTSRECLDIPHPHPRHRPWTGKPKG